MGMAHATHRPPHTIEDYLALPDDVRAELIHGELFVTPAPGCWHQALLGRLHLLLHARVAARGEGRVYLAPVDVYLIRRHIVQPDVVVIRKEHLDIVGRTVDGAPDLLVEILSPSHPERDLLVKRDLYAAAGVPEYWIVDPGREGVQVLQLDDGVYAPRGWFTGTAPLVSPWLGTLDCTPATLFAPE